MSVRLSATLWKKVDVTSRAKIGYAILFVALIGSPTIWACVEISSPKDSPSSFTVVATDRGKPLSGFKVIIDGLSSARSEEHTSELQSQSNLVCRLLLEKKKIAIRLDCRPAIISSRRHEQSEPRRPPLVSLHLRRHVVRVQGLVRVEPGVGAFLELLPGDAVRSGMGDAGGSPCAADERDRVRDGQPAAVDPERAARVQEAIERVLDALRMPALDQRPPQMRPPPVLPAAPRAHALQGHLRAPRRLRARDH